MPTVLITGANRGLGLEFARQYASEGWEVIATLRNKDEAADELARVLRVSQIEQLQLTDLSDSVESFLAFIGTQPLDLLICNAGLYGPRHIVSAEDGEDWLQSLAVMAVAPVLIASRLMPNLAARGGKAIAITSRMGSIADNGSGGFIAYRSAKAALNAAWTSLAIDHQASGVAFALLHPGWVKTRMGGERAPVDPQESVTGMRHVISELQPSGRAPFLDFGASPYPGDALIFGRGLSIGAPSFHIGRIEPPGSSRAAVAVLNVV